MINEIIYNKIYNCEVDNADKVTFNFTKDENDYTYMNIEVVVGEAVSEKTLLLTTQSEVDDFDIESVNEILQQGGIKLLNMEG
ncbi:hypothetical protein [Mammaliicoccus lentus]|uniref:hypothetical protein n=1 Tax=Mammaliicoccus lentus TaxID=42858 RepID=UPI001072D97E|nr:hypothetical protein [Mammaliicoccus lentus]MBF0793320.1 hypothetical protein [Mammaliicoccus lentus]TFV17825.1 hypothetical protein E4T78_01570 [Mammaliicoccus lentus]